MFDQLLVPIIRLLLSLLLKCCTYRLQRWRAASVHAVGCVGATHPVVGELDWGWWDCAAASRMDCPNGLAVGDRDATPDTETPEHETNRNDKGRDESEAEQRDKGGKTGVRVGGRQERSGHKKFSPRGLWERESS